MSSHFRFLLYAVIAVALIVSPAAEATAQEHGASRLGYFAAAGWFRPTGALASTNPRFASGEDIIIGPGAMLGLGVVVNLPAPIPSLRASVQHVPNAKLIVEGNGGRETLGRTGVTMILGEAVATPLRTGVLSAHVAAGAGLLLYGFPDIGDPEQQRTVADGRTSPAVSLGLGLSKAFRRFTLSISAADLISTFDSPPVEGPTGDQADVDNMQHDLTFLLRLGIPLGPPVQ